MTQDTKKTSRSLAGIAGIVAAGTLISKVFGLVRQLAIAAAFGQGVVAEAYNFAYNIPGFLLILLGGINGPFHSAIVSVLAKRDKEEAAPLVETITTLITGILLIVTIVLVLFAGNFIDLVAARLDVREQGDIIRDLAIVQLRWMAPMAILAGLVGIGFGTLNSANLYWLPSISPLLSSITVVIGVGFLWLQLGNKITDPQYALEGAVVLALGTLAGALLQWVVQLVAQAKAGMGGFRWRFNFNQPGVGEVMRLMGPATVSSGMLQINVLVNTFFSSGIASAAPALANSGLLVQTPLGIISNMILVPLLPVFSKLADPKDWDELKSRIRQGLVLTGFTMLPLGALTIALSMPIVQVVYERGAFKKADSELVASLLIAYGTGMFVYLARDVLVRVFYALGDGDTPFRISAFNILLNAGLDYLFVMVFNFGATGLVLATVGVNLSSTLMLLWVLNRRLNGLPLLQWSFPIIGLTIASIVAGFISFGTLQGCQRFLGTQGLVIIATELCISGLIGLAIFGIIATQMKLPEVNSFVNKLRQRILKR